MGNLHEKCKEGEGCERQNRTTDNCLAYINPSRWWDGVPPYSGHCPLATHISLAVEEKINRRRVGQQKQKKTA